MNILKSTLLISLFSSFALQANAAETGSIDDTYAQGFEAYAKELKKSGADSLTSHAIESYTQDIEKAQLSAGYIGPKIQIPNPIKVAEGIYTVVGSLIWHNPANYGLNNNLTFIEFESGVFVFNAGPNPAVASAFHRIIKQHTSKPVKWVAVENHQGHAYLGASYWYDQGVRKFYSHSRANKDFGNSFDSIKKSWGNQVGHEITYQARNMSDKFVTFDDRLTVDVGGGETVELLNFGPGHTPGATVMYLPKRNIVLPGDLAYNQRMISLFSYTDSIAWARTYERFMEAMPEDVMVIPGHGGPTNMAKAKQDTYDYLVFMHDAIKKHIQQGGTEIDLDKIDQSAYKDRPVFNETYRHNAVHVYKEILAQEY